MKRKEAVWITNYTFWVQRPQNNESANSIHISINYCCSIPHYRLWNYTSGAESFLSMSLNQTIQGKVLSVLCSDRPTNVMFVDKTQHQHGCSSNLLGQSLLCLIKQDTVNPIWVSPWTPAHSTYKKQTPSVIKTAIPLTKGRNIRLHISSVSFVLLWTATI